ncbi:hypothetical protein IP69_07260 [Bosea sp. AAP35]|uniref:hypothetical protein n=1 Tax=Bosea sp. AAP35 TaxID=1523417 RepID=UPI0006B91775|nr:hypothetical protein [Bosea sp. AAP35]KPF71111.1 hypothetical protein IP69_07260 [Bosea sp. AAP35]
MPLPNRVGPDGRLFAHAARGLLLGNRGGRFHDPQTLALPRRLYASRQWICCLLAFKGRHRPVWGRGYTELFFCDEVTALAAGHRPCMECRRADALAYRAALMRGEGLRVAPSFPEIDRLLDGQRRRSQIKRVHSLAADALPDGAMVSCGLRLLAIRGTGALVWTPDGYDAVERRPTGVVSVLTPPASLAALAHGYTPLWHPSAAAIAGPSPVDACLVPST